MPFVFSEQHIVDYYRDGYTIFRSILPPALIRDLRRATESGREIARQEQGGQAQRLQPLVKYLDRLERGPFQDYLELPELADAIRRVLSREHYMAGFDILAVLYEPAQRPSGVLWHRDIGEGSPEVDPVAMRQLIRDPLFFIQVSCALYTDSCLWYVPGSHGRPDLDQEKAIAEGRPDLDGVDEAEAERLCIDYARAMPGAVQTVLEPGDFMFYRTNAWHQGSYVPYRKRATLHDYIWNPAAETWYRNWPGGALNRRMAREKAEQEAAQKTSGDQARS